MKGISSSETASAPAETSVVSHGLASEMLRHGASLAEIGELVRARELCERLLGYASPLGLYAEEIDYRTGRHLGNFPQAFTHLALINAVMHVIRADEASQPDRMPTGTDWRSGLDG